MRYKKSNLLLVWFAIFLYGFTTIAQTNRPNRYWVMLTDKNNSTYSLQNPTSFLSSDALSRRNLQSIVIDSLDLPVNSSYVTQIKSMGVRVLFCSRWFNAVVIETDSISSQLPAVLALPFVKNHSKVLRLKYSTDFSIEGPPNTICLNKKKEMNAYDYGQANLQIEQLNGICLHNLGYDGKGIHIAVLDAGFRKANQLEALSETFLQGRLKYNVDFSYRNPIPLYSDSTNSHGTAVLSTMAANQSGTMVGTAPKSDYTLIRTEYAPDEFIMEEFSWVAGAEYADSVGCDIINSSLGYTTFDDPSQNHSFSSLDGKTSFASRAATLASRKGLIVCNSAGNGGGGAWYKIGIPADADSIFTVGAIDSDQVLAPFSSVGPTFDGRIKPDLVALGSSATILNSYSGNVALSSGTSFSSPILAGMIASLWSAFPEKSNMEIIKAVKESADRFSTPDNFYGYGRPDFCAAYAILKGYNFSEDQFIPLASNPISESYQAEFIAKNEQDVIVTLCDVNGKQIWKNEKHLTTKSTWKLIFSTVNLSSGIYFLKAQSDQFQQTHKLIKP